MGVELRKKPKDLSASVRSMVDDRRHLFALSTLPNLREVFSPRTLGMHDVVSCTVRRRDSQLRRAWHITVNHAFRRRRGHEISCFYVSFSNTELTGGFVMTTLRHS